MEKKEKLKDELIKMSNDSKQRAIYEMRAKILKDKVSALNSAKEEKAIEIAKNLLDILDNETIAMKTGLSIDTVKEFREK
ncbi:MAG: hypothetical protein AB6733_24640 [Clostridiaceae bacterium]